MVAVIATLVELLALGGFIYATYITSLSAYWYYYAAAFASLLLLILILKPSRRSAAPLIGKKTMRAAIYDFSHSSGFSVDEYHSVPSFGPDDVVIKVVAAAINPVDYKVITPAIPFVRHFFSNIVGRDFSGVIVHAGEKVMTAKAGDYVYGNAYGGTLAEYTVANVSTIGKCPQTLNWQETAGIPVAGLTGYQVYQKNGLKFGDRVMVIGASGGCGLIGVQLAKTLGAYVIAICSTKNIQLVKSVGADEVIDYTEANFVKRIEPGTLDFIYDVVSSPEDPDQEPWARPLLKKGATSPYSKINGSHGDWARAILDFVFGIPAQRSKFDLHLMKSNRKDFNDLADLIDRGKIKILIDSELSLESEAIRKGFERQKSRRAKGKIVFHIDPDYTPLK